MLVLNRKEGESFTIDGLIRIKIIKDGKKVSLGIDAPEHMQIVKDESTLQEGQQLCSIIWG